MSNELASFPTNLRLETFEMVNVGRAGAGWPQALFAREQAARQSPFGGWERIYIYCDGSVQVAAAQDGNFDAWEQSNTTEIPQPNQ